ncbi:site-specific integrase [Thalassobaculum sp.]|uniref:tyrosine-type recombinase/integrase n=1 Tax=Thalassobaculum sp. TaxID=2022740 RepID=UPI0032EF90F0
MSETKLMKRVVDGLEPGDRDYVVWDKEIAGFGVRVRTSGTKTYVFKYRYRNRQQWYSIGKHGTWTTDQARRKAGELNVLVLSGEDPASKKQADRKAMTVSELCDLYLEEGIAGKKAQTVEMDRIRIDTHVRPLIGFLKVPDVTRRDMQSLMTEIATPRPWLDPNVTRGSSADDGSAKDGATAPKKKRKTYSRTIGGKGVANRTIGMLGGIFSFAIDRELRQDNPVVGVKKFKEKRLNRRLKDEELQRLAAVLQHYEPIPGANPAVNAIRLLLLLGCRKAEILTLEWDDVHLESGLIHLRDSKSGERHVQMNSMAKDVLRGIHRVPDNPHVIPGNKEGQHFIALQKSWERIRKEAGIPDVRIHDLRHTYASIAADMGFSLQAIGKLLGHKKASSTERYAHLADAPLKHATETVSATIAGRMSGQISPLAQTAA